MRSSSPSSRSSTSTSRRTATSAQSAGTWPTSWWRASRSPSPRSSTTFRSTRTSSAGSWQASSGRRRRRRLPSDSETPDLQRAVALLEGGDWQAAHAIVQKDEESALACWAHGIVHLMEGDLPNARYWYRKANRRLDDDIPVEIAALSESLKR